MGLFNAPRTYPSFYAPYYDTFNFYDLANTPRFFRKLPKFVPFADKYAAAEK
jgi:hypothetical protein